MKGKKGILPNIEEPTRTNFNVSYSRISTADWNKYGAEFAIWLAGVKYATNKIKAELLKQKKNEL